MSDKTKTSGNIIINTDDETFSFATNKIVLSKTNLRNFNINYTSDGDIVSGSGYKYSMDDPDSVPLVAQRLLHHPQLGRMSEILGPLLSLGSTVAMSDLFMLALNQFLQYPYSYPDGFNSLIKLVLSHECVPTSFLSDFCLYLKYLKNTNTPNYYNKGY